MTPEMYRMTKHLVTNSEHFEKDCDYFFCQLTESFDWYKALDICRQVAVLALVFAIGWKNFLALADVIFFLQREDFDSAAKYFTDKGYPYLAEILKSGQFNLP
jgi:hypothetical protein